MRSGLLLLLVILVAATSARSQETVTIPSLPLGDVPQEGREQFEALEAEIAELSAAGGDPVGLAQAYGELGKLSFLYDFLDPAEAAWTNASALLPSASRWHYYLGVLYRLKGDLASAQESLQAALDLDGDDVATLIRLGRVRFDQGRTPEAALLFEEALQKAPGSAAALYGLGRIAVAEGRYEEALGVLEEAAQDQPAESAVHHQLGLAYRGLGDLERAREHLSRSQGVRVTFSDPWMEHMVGMAQGAHLRVRLALQAQRSGNLGQAVRLLEEAVALDPENAWIRYNLGVVHQEAGDLQGATGEYGTAVELDPRYRDAHFNLGQLLAGTEDYEGAARHFRAAAEIDSEDRQARLELAVALSRLERREEALTELEMLNAMAPDFVESRLALATLLGQLGRNAEARTEVTAVLEGDASSAELAEAHLVLARLLEPTDIPGALAHYTAAVELDPGSVEVGYGLAMALGRQGRFPAAAQRFDSLVDLAPGDAELRMGQAMAHLLGEDYRGTQQLLEAALVTFPGDADLIHSLARLLATCPDAAIRDGERAVELAQSALQGRQSLEHAETLAMALAEAGRYGDATALQRQVVDQRRRRGEPRLLSASERYLSFFEQGRPVRSPWMGGG